VTYFNPMMRVEVTLTGVYISDSAGVETEGGARRAGLRVLPSEALVVQCALPFGVTLTIPLPAPAPARDPSGGEGVGAVESPWEWVGEASGDLYSQWILFLASQPGEDVRDSTGTAAGGNVSGTGDRSEVTFCFACQDRLQRDALALSIRALAGFDPSAEGGRRLRVLPWLGGEGAVARASSGAGSQDICLRLKTLEEENALLRRHKNELNLRLMEQSGAVGDVGVVPGRTRESAGSVDSSKDSSATGGEASNESELQASRSRVKELEAALDVSRSRLVRIGSLCRWR